MSTNTSHQTVNHLPAAARDIAREATEIAKATAQRTSDTAKDLYQSAALRAEDTLANSRQYVRQNPMLVVATAFTFGAAIGCLLMMRRKTLFSDHSMKLPLHSIGDGLFAALAPLAHRVHDGYDVAKSGADKAMDRVQRLDSARVLDSLSDQVGRFGSNLKFWK